MSFDYFHYDSNGKNMMCMHEVQTIEEKQNIKMCVGFTEIAPIYCENMCSVVPALRIV